MAQRISFTHTSAEVRIAQEVFKDFLIRANLIVSSEEESGNDTLTLEEIVDIFLEEFN